jgi:hypothetical protein
MQKLKGAVALACTSLLVACGGGGANDTQPESVPHPEGRYDGYNSTLTRAGTALVIGARSYWLFYSASGNPSVLAGVVQGDITASSVAGLLSPNARDFNYESQSTTFGTVSADFTPKASIAAVMRYDIGGTGDFSGAYNGTFGLTPTLQAIAGTYSGTAATVVSGRQASTLAVSADGAFTASAGGCTTSGTITPRPAADDSGSSSPRYGGNAYDFSITFGGAPCYYAGQTFTGVALYDADTKALLAAAPNSARTDALAFMGTKP